MVGKAEPHPNIVTSKSAMTIYYNMNSGAKIMQTECKTASSLACFAEVLPIFAVVTTMIVQTECKIKCIDMVKRMFLSYIQNH